MVSNDTIDLGLWPTKSSEPGKGKPRKNANPGRFLLAYSLFHSEIANWLLQRCQDTLLSYCVEREQIITLAVPGSFELASAISGYSRRNPDSDIAAAVALGCIIKGETSHFDYVCSGTVNALAQLNAQGDYPVVFGVLTTSSAQEANERASPERMDKGRDFALTALWMANMLG